ncbi:hypothetical protein FOXYS1_2078 [Fusarium oxysporum]|uniref:Uncharacterized protein n=1 Tax=Fusarium oxysporum TaxID=5507 RepID=A0A8H5AKX0_FUSOX|nr:hypothetical protein FOXYS1_2078 [Fusarium oxysporum]
MASSSTNPPTAPVPFDVRVHTPANLNRGARAALLLNSPAVVNSPIGVSPKPGRTAETPSSPLNAATTAAATEGAERANPPLTFEHQPVSILESANRLARERAEEYNAKLIVFQAFCAKFEEAAQQFTTGSQRLFAQQFADSFLDSWKRELSGVGSPSKPTYSSVAAAASLSWIHQIQEVKQAIFVGFFGPIGVSAIFYLTISLNFIDEHLSNEMPSREAM